MKFTSHACILVFCLALIVSVSIADESGVLHERASKETENSKAIEDKDVAAHGDGTLTDSNKPPSFDNGANDDLEHSKSIEKDDAAARDYGNLQDSNKKASMETERFKSVKNVDVASQGIEKATDSKKIASLTSGAVHEMESSKSVENANASLLSDANKEIERSKSVENADAAAKDIGDLLASDEPESSKSDDDDNGRSQVNGKSDKKLPHEGAADDHSKQVNKSSASLQAVGNLTDSIKLKTTENQTLLTLTLGNGNESDYFSASYPKKDKDHDNRNGSRIDDMKVKGSLRHPVQNVTDDKKIWKNKSSSNQLVPRTSLLAAGAVMCILVHKVSGSLGLD